MCINGRSDVCCCECKVVSDECDEPTPCLVQDVCMPGMTLYTSGVFSLGVSLVCDTICMCVVNKQFELLEFVFDSVSVDLQYDEISLTFTAGSVC